MTTFSVVIDVDDQNQHASTSVAKLIASFTDNEECSSLPGIRVADIAIGNHITPQALQEKVHGT